MSKKVRIIPTDSTRSLSSDVNDNESYEPNSSYANYLPAASTEGRGIKQRYKFLVSIINTYNSLF